MKKAYEIRVPALEIRQGDRQRLYSFAVDGKRLPEFATVSRISRNDRSDLEGYQRPEVLAHIGEIREYLESESPMIPNALVIAFDERVRFEGLTTGDGDDEDARHGYLVIPVDPELDEVDKPGWIVDGQQRAAAIRDARVTSFPVCITAFITDSVDEQRAQFILVNSTKPLPKGLIYELLPGVEGHLPRQLQRRRFPAELLTELNFRNGPLGGRIRTPTNPDGNIKDNSVLKMLENSLNDGALYRMRDPLSGDGDVEGMIALLHNFWNAVATVFPEAWNAKPRDSRLVHGAGILCMGFIMDAIADRYIEQEIPEEEEFEHDLKMLAPICRWTKGYWEFGDEDRRKWNEIQNTSKDIQLLANYLLTEYRRRVWSVASQTKRVAAAGEVTG